MRYEMVIGLEIHVQLATRAKLFCADPTAFGAAPNSQVSPVSLAHPGTLPRLNGRALECAVQLGLALGCDIRRFSRFDRKNYFYADLPKGYQITQNEYPICRGGRLTPLGPAEGAPPLHWKAGQGVRLSHVHLEEDAGKSLHDQDPHDSLIDLNRAGVPLLEIVTEPELRSAAEASACLEAVRRLVRWLGISDGNMEEGSLRCDVNISVRPAGQEALGTRCEIKNVNSFRFVRRAIEHEAARQIQILENGGRIVQQTRGFDADSGTTYALREKEQAHDYRYFPDPDLPPIALTDDEIEQIRAALPPLPDAVERELQEKYGLPAADAALLTQERDTAFYFLTILAHNPAPPARAVANFIIQRVRPWAGANGKTAGDFPLDAAQIAEYLDLIESGRLGASAAAQRLLPVLMEQPGASPAGLAAGLNLLQTADADFLEKIVADTLARFPEKVAEYRRGKKGLLGFFMGEAMRASGGRAEPGAATRLLREKLDA